MRRVSVRAFEDRDHPEGGHAVLLLEGVDRLPEDSTFLIRPVDDTVGELPAAWPTGSHAPVEIRAAPDGLEIVVGPAVVDSECLLPGSIVAIDFPAAQLSGELVWPDVPPTRRPKRRNLAVSRTARNVRLGVVQRGEEPHGVEDAPIAAANDPGGTDDGEPASVPPPAPRKAASDDVLAMPARALSSLDYEPRTAALRGSGPERVVAPPASAAREPAERANVSPPPAHPASDPPENSYLAEATVSRLRHIEKEASSLGDGKPAGQPWLDSATSRGRISRSISRKRSRSAMDTDWQGQEGSGITGKTILGVGAAMLLSAVVVLALVAPDRILAPLAKIWSSAGEVAGRSSQVELADDPPDSLYEALLTADTSPRGVAADIPLSKVLENAKKLSLTAAAAVDRDEGAYWRKRYIVGAIGSDRTRKALTQLGSLYAEPSGPSPDFVKARLLWEIASAAGDPVAMCFLGQLHESGISVVADKKTALQWYERGKRAGGCPAVDESIARMRQ